MAIKLLRSNSTTRASSQRVLEDGQPLYEKDTNKLYVGDGTTQAKNLRCITTDRLKTSETRPKAEVKRGTGAVTKEIALLEDIPQVGEWITVGGTRATLTEAGTYQVIASNMQSIIYWDGSTAAEGAKSTKPTVVGASAYLNINTVYPYIDASGTLSLKLITVSDSMGKWAESTSQQAGFKYRKIH